MPGRHYTVRGLSIKPLRGERVQPVKSNRGRPIVHTEPWAKITVVLLDRHVAYLDRLAIDIRADCMWPPGCLWHLGIDLARHLRQKRSMPLREENRLCRRVLPGDTSIH